MRSPGELLRREADSKHLPQGLPWLQECDQPGDGGLSFVGQQRAVPAWIRTLFVRLTPRQLRRQVADGAGVDTHAVRLGKGGYAAPKATIDEEGKKGKEEEEENEPS